MLLTALIVRQMLGGAVIELNCSAKQSSAELSAVSAPDLNFLFTEGLEELGSHINLLVLNTVDLVRRPGGEAR
jgi:hypothetical protein